MVTPVRAEVLPTGTLLQSFRDAGDYTDCFVIDVDGAVAHSDFVRAFYTSRLFKIERFILTWAVNKPSNDMEAAALSMGDMNSFAAWSVEGRTDNQLLMCDYQHRTRSWLMSESLAAGKQTRLYFGTAFASLRPDGKKDRAFGLAFRLLTSLHKIYARALLRAAVGNLSL